MADSWGILVDENLEPQIARYLEREGISATHVNDAIFSGAGDEDDVLPYARDHDLLILTSDVKDFRGLPADQHEGILILFDEKRSAHETVDAVLDILDAYGDRDELRGYEYVDKWL